MHANIDEQSIPQSSIRTISKIETSTMVKSFSPSLINSLFATFTLGCCLLIATNAFSIEVKVNKALLTKPDTKLVGSIDQGTSSSRFLLFTPKGEIAASAQLELKQIFHPEKEGWHEQLPNDLWKNTLACMNAVGDVLQENECKVPISAIGITNQRETVIAWNRATGEPYYNAIVWTDTRTISVADKIIASKSDNKEVFRARSGLPVASYFAGGRVRWLLDNVEQLREDVNDSEKAKDVCFGTVDTWLLYKLTCGKRFATDVSNASRWMFMDLKTCQFDRDLVDRVCAPHNLPLACLPDICPSSFEFGNVDTNCGLDGHKKFFKEVPISGILGDQQAALFGQTAFNEGQAKNTYGTGLFLMMNTGNKPIPSNSGLLTTVGYQVGEKGDVVYALEGSVSHSGSTIRWLRDNLKIIDSPADSEKFASETSSNQGLYMVPAFSGLFSPHWDSTARACIVGMTASHHRGHVCRAAIEATCYQSKEIFDAISNDSSVQLTQLNVDGGATANRLMMQFQADMLGVPVVKPLVMETTALGAAYAAGLAVGVWKDLDEIRQLWAVAEKFEASMPESERAKNWKGWTKAVEKSKGWVEE